jgi:cardiolipin synthase A/B
LLMLLLPGLGVLAYLFFGRNAKAFSAERVLRRQLSDAATQPHIKQLLAQQAEFLRNSNRLSEVERRTAQLLLRNSSALLTLHNSVEILQNAAQKYPRLLADLRAATHSISMQYYSWESDSFTEQLKDILIERARAGVQVRALYDWLGSFGALSKRYIAELRAAGVRFEPYLFQQKLHDIGYRNHRKIVVIDGDIAYLGGINMSNEHLTGGKHFASWRDTAIRVQGEAATALQTIFAAGWFNTTRERMDDPALYQSSRPDKITPMQIVSAGPDSEWGAIRQQYFRMITNAQERILLQSPFFILDESIAEALKTACLAGIDVRIMLTPRGGMYQVPYRAGFTFCDDVARAGAKVYFYQAGYLHAKTMAIDGEVCSIGTANLDTRSTSINYESNAVIYDVALTQQLEHNFYEDIKHCSEFSWREYRKRPWHSRFRDSTSRLLSPLL